MKRAVVWCALCVVLISLFTLLTSAKEDPLEVQEREIEEEWQSFQASIPPEVADYLPSELLAGSLTDSAEAIAEAATLSGVMRTVGRLTGLALREHLSLLASLCGVLLLSAVFRALSAEHSGGVGTALCLCGVLCTVLVVFSTGRVRFFEISAYFENLKTLCVSILPLMGALYAMGGNIGAAAANHTMLTAFLAILQTVISSGVMPVAGVCLSLSVADAVTGKGALRSLSALIKRTYVLVLSFLMLILCFVLGVQTTLSAGTDSLALRTARFAAGSFLPVVGGSIAETLRTVSGSVQYLRSVAGTGAILVLLFAFLPAFLSVWMGRLTFSLSGAVAKLLGCNGESDLLCELASVFGYFLAVIACLFVTLVFSLTVFARCAAAGG